MLLRRRLLVRGLQGILSRLTLNHLKHQLPGTGCNVGGLDTPAGNFGNVVAERRPGSVADRTEKHSIAPVHWEGVHRPDTGLESSAPVVVVGRDVGAVDCSLFFCRVWLGAVFDTLSYAVLFVSAKRFYLAHLRLGTYTLGRKEALRSIYVYKNSLYMY